MTFIVSALLSFISFVVWRNAATKIVIIGASKDGLPVILDTK